VNALPRAEVAARIAAYLQNPEPDGLSAVAREVFAFQYEHNAPFRRFCDGRGVTPDAVRTWQDIPAAPAVAFKRFALTCAPEEECTPERGGRVFHSSGTTGTETSRHFMDATALNLYRLSLRAGYSRFVMPDGARLPVLALMAPPDLALHSSLSFMLGELIGEYGGAFFIGDGWQERLAETLRQLEGPVVVFGTAFAWVHFFDSVSETFALPLGSRVVETGGFKGRSREVEREELYALFTERLGVLVTHSLSEYGMSEMASQFYDSTLYDHVHGIVRPSRKVSPLWLRTRIMDPVTGKEARAGEAGLLAHYDLANLNSVLAIQTEDMGIVAEEGDGFYLLGRAPGAVLRGCSLTAEELMISRV
jgi:hypothetical protein